MWVVGICPIFCPQVRCNDHPAWSSSFFFCLASSLAALASFFAFCFAALASSSSSISFAAWQGKHTVMKWKVWESEEHVHIWSEKCEQFMICSEELGTMCWGAVEYFALWMPDPVGVAEGSCGTKNTSWGCEIRDTNDECTPGQDQVSKVALSETMACWNGSPCLHEVIDGAGCFAIYLRVPFPCLGYAQDHAFVVAILEPGRAEQKGSGPPCFVHKAFLEILNKAQNNNQCDTSPHWQNEAVSRNCVKQNGHDIDKCWAWIVMCAIPPTPMPYQLQNPKHEQTHTHMQNTTHHCNSNRNCWGGSCCAVLLCRVGVWLCGIRFFSSGNTNTQYWPFPMAVMLWSEVPSLRQYVIAHLVLTLMQLSVPPTQKLTMMTTTRNEVMWTTSGCRLSQSTNN